VPLESTIYWSLAAVIVAAVVLPYLHSFRRRVARDRERKAEAARLGIDRPVAQFPFVDALSCIGCGACIAACPEGDVLGIVGGTAVVINGLRCVGHGHCETVCPVEGIEVGLGDLKARKDVPLLDDSLETTVPGIFVAGELGGLALVRNAAVQGRQAMDGILQRVRALERRDASVLDVAIIGAGPSGLSAGLSAAAAGLDYVVLEKEESLGGSLLHFPRRKMVLTQPVELPPWGELSREEYLKEELLGLFESMVSEVPLTVRFGENVEHIERQNGHFVIDTGKSRQLARFVLLALGRRGEPRKLGVPGEELSKVMYRLMDAESYEGERILVVGGGDSAAEAAIGLARHTRNTVTLSYRKDKLVRIKKKNFEKIEKLIESGRIHPLMASNVAEIRADSVALRMPEDKTTEIENDYVFVFAGGIPPFKFLEKIGVGLGGNG